MKDKFITLKQLLEDNNDEDPSYGELLLTKEWRDFRKIILKRDNHQCQICKREGNQLAWWLKDMGEFYVRPSTEIEKKYLNNDIEYCSTHVELHVHHKYYVKDHYPWQYSEDALITVCMECHDNIHNNEEIPVYLKIDKEIKLPTCKCAKCNGKGYIKTYKYYMNGVCFSCDGAGYKILNNSLE